MPGSTAGRVNPMLIQVCSQARALTLAAEAQEKTAILSITSTGDEEVAFPENANIQSILHLKVNDLVSAYDEEGFPYGRPLPEPGDFEGLKAFVSSLRCERLIVHCWEGTSRSAAVAKAIYESRGCRDQLLPGPRFDPNPLIYDLARQALT